MSDGPIAFHDLAAITILNRAKEHFQCGETETGVKFLETLMEIYPDSIQAEEARHMLRQGALGTLIWHF